MDTVFWIAMVVIFISLIIHIRFNSSQGKDERGQAIIGKSSQLAFIAILLGFVGHMIYFQFGTPTIDEVSLLLKVWMAIVFGLYAIGIKLFQREI